MSKFYIQVVLSFLFLGFFFSNLHAFPLIPNDEMTPGAYCSEDDSDFKGHRGKEKYPYCFRNVSQGLKRVIYEKYGIPKSCRGHYTIDHLIPLSMGGNNDFENLWPEHFLIKDTRENMEQDIFNEIMEGHIKRDEGVAELLEAKLNPDVDAIRQSCEGRRDPCDQFRAKIIQKAKELNLNY